MVEQIRMHNFALLWQKIKKDALSAIDEVGQSGYWILGKNVQDFEATLAAYWQLPYAAGCASGMDAIEIGLRCTGMLPGDKVLTTPLSAFATTLAIIRAGGIPVYADVDDSALLDLDCVETILNKHSDIKYMLPVHLYGQAMNLNRLKLLASQYNLRIIEDCAQAIGATYMGCKVGTAGDIAAVSFYPTKNLGAMGDGGAILCSKEEYAEQAKSYRNYGQTTKFIHELQGLNSRLDEIHAAILKVMLTHLDSHTKRRCEIAAYYRDNLRHKHLTCLPVPEGSCPVWHIFPVLVSSNREEFSHYLRQNGVESTTHYPIPIPAQTALKASDIIIAAPLANTERICAQQLSLPIHPFMSDVEAEYVVRICNEWAF